MSQYFDTTLYTGNGNITEVNLGYKPDYIWIKRNLSYAFTFAVNDSLTAIMPTSNPADDLIDWCIANNVKVDKTDKNPSDRNFSAKDLTTILRFPNEMTKTVFVLKFGGKRESLNWNIFDTNETHPKAQINI